jgi:hypothetical protein
MSKMNKRLEKSKRLLNAEIVEPQTLDRTLIDKSFVQIGNKKNYTFAFGTVYDGLYKKKQIIIKQINSVVDIAVLSKIQKGILLNWNLKDCDYVLKVYGLSKTHDNWMIITECTSFDILNNLFKYQIDNRDKGCEGSEKRLVTNLFCFFTALRFVRNPLRFRIRLL